MITGSGSAQLCAEYIIQADGQADSWRRRLESLGPSVTHQMFQKCQSAIAYWTHVSASYERALIEYNKPTKEIL